jgi:hypothetical protein
LREQSTRPIGAVLTLKLRGAYHGNNLERCQILFSSLVAFADPGLFSEILVVVPRHDVSAARQLCAAWKSLPLKVINEEEYLPEIRKHWRTDGWHRQQVLKLHAANYFSDPYFLILDPDVILCKRLSLAHLFVGSRALLEPETRGRRPEWWTGSAKLLRLPVDLSAPAMFVTPAILARAICLRLFQRLEECHRERWPAVLRHRRSRPWTEYSLYYLLAEHYGMQPHYHVTAGIDTPRHLHCPSAVWYKPEFDTWDVEACFDAAAPGFFTVVQSNTRIAPEAIWLRVRAFLDRPPCSVSHAGKYRGG